MAEHRLALSPSSAVFLNGLVLPAAEAQLSIGDQGTLYGLGFFETFRTSGGHPHHWKFNRARLEPACTKAGIVLPDSFLAGDEVRLGQVVTQLLHANGNADAVFRYTVTAGVENRPSEFLTARPLPAPPPQDGISLRVLKVRRDSGEWIPRPKSLNYANAMLGALELQHRRASPDDEGLFLSRDGEYVVETTRQSIAWIVKGFVCFPDSTTGAVMGTTLSWLQSRGLPYETVRASLADILKVDAIFCLNSVRGITPVSEIWDERDGSKLGSFSSAAHPLVCALQQHWSEALTATATRRPPLGSVSAGPLTRPWHT